LKAVERIISRHTKLNNHLTLWMEKSANIHSLLEEFKAFKMGLLVIVIVSPDTLVCETGLQHAMTRDAVSLAGDLTLT